MKDNIETISFRVYLGTLFVFYTSYILIAMGLYSVDPKFLHILALFLHTFICTFLIYRFNPFVKTEFHPIMDKHIIFGSAIVLLFDVVFSEIGLNTTNLFNDIKYKIHSSLTFNGN